MQNLILCVIKEQNLIATWHRLTPDPARSEGGGGGGGHAGTRVFP